MKEGQEYFVKSKNLLDEQTIAELNKHANGMYRMGKPQWREGKSDNLSENGWYYRIEPCPPLPFGLFGGTESEYFKSKGLEFITIKPGFTEMH